MKIYTFILFVILIIGFISCQNEELNVVTKKIQYDVNIKSPSPDYDWWIQNLVGPERERLIDLIVDGAISGKWQAYDYFNDSISVLEVRTIFSDTLMATIMNDFPPYDLYDTVIISTISKSDIERIRFLEEWYINSDNLYFYKKILGIAPIAKRLDFNGIERWQPLFWIYVDESFIKDLSNNNQ